MTTYNSWPTGCCALWELEKIECQIRKQAIKDVENEETKNKNQRTEGPKNLWKIMYVNRQSVITKNCVVKVIYIN